MAASNASAAKSVEWVPQIVTKPPGPKAMEFLEHEVRRHVSNVRYSILPNFVPDGTAKGSLVRDVDGNIFIDFMAGVGVNALGHAHDKVIKAVSDQLRNGAIHLNFHLGNYEAYSEYLDLVASTMPGELKNGKGILGNSGAEANEAALKLARYVTHKQNVISFFPSFHGRTAGVLGATTGAKGRLYAASVPGFFSVNYPYAYRLPDDKNVTEYVLSQIQEVLNNLSPAENTAAVLLEPIAGEPGVIVPPKDFMPKLIELAHQNDILVIADEVQMGFGRTGRWWASENFNAVPDIISFAKAAGGGFPLGGIIAKSEIADEWPTGHHASTFGGNVIACRAGIAVIKSIREEHLVDRAAEKGKEILSMLHELQKNTEAIGDVRGIGMIVGVEFVKDRKTKEPWPDAAKRTKEEAFKRGLLVSNTGPYSNVLRFSPPLNTSNEILHKGMSIIETAIKKAIK